MRPKIELFAILLILMYVNVSSFEPKMSPSSNSFFISYSQVILDNINNLEDPLQQIAEYKNFVDKLSGADLYSITTVMLSYLVTKLRKQYANNTDLTYIINNLPREVVGFPWKVPMSIYNDDSKQFICATGKQELSESSSHKIYSSLDRSENCLWNIKPDANGWYFKIKNIANKQYLYAVDGEQKMRTLSTIKSKENITDMSDKWQFVPSLNRAHSYLEYQIMNFKWNEFVSEGDSAEVVATKSKYCEANSCMWRLIKEPEQPSTKRKQILSDLYGEYEKNPDTAETLLHYASTSSSRLAEYIEVFRLMKAHNDFYTVAGIILDYNVQQMLKQQPYDFYLNDMENHFRSLWLPVPWDRKIKIQNEDDKTFICTEKTFFRSNVIRMMENLRETCYWVFEINPSGLYINIKNLANNMYMYVGNMAKNEQQKGQVLLISKKMSDKDKWQLAHQRSKKHKVAIKSVAYNDYVYSLDRNRPATKDISKETCKSCSWLIHEVPLN